MYAENLVKNKITNNILKKRLQEEDVKNGFLLDGYPRTLNQSEALKTNLEDLGRSLDAVIYLKVPTEILMERLMGRYICSNYGGTYPKIFIPKKVEGDCERGDGSAFSIIDNEKE